MQECVAVAVVPCLLVKRSSDADWTYFYDPIEGFDYEWGFLYELEVAVTNIENPLADGSSRAYSMVSMNSKLQVQPDTVFQYSSIHAPEQITLQSENTYSLFFWGEREFNCIPFDCLALQSLLDQQHSILFEFRHPDNSGNPMQLSRILCSDTADAYRNSCLP